MGALQKPKTGCILSTCGSDPRVGSIALPMVEGLLPFNSHGRMHLEVSRLFLVRPWVARNCLLVRSRGFLGGFGAELMPLRKVRELL